MSLTEWVNAAGRGDARESPRGSALAELKRRVRDILPSDQVASMMAVNPKQAENELRIACMRVFEESPGWPRGIKRGPNWRGRCLMVFSGSVPSRRCWQTPR